MEAADFSELVLSRHCTFTCNEYLKLSSQNRSVNVNRGVESARDVE